MSGNFKGSDSLAAEGSDSARLQGALEREMDKVRRDHTGKDDGKYWMYFLGTTADNKDQMGLAFSTDLVHWSEATDTPVLPVRAGQFDSRVAEPGPAPIVTSKGIVLVYNGADDELVYRTGIAVFDLHDPGHLISRSDKPVLAPEKDWEKIGQVPNVIFVEGMVRQSDRYLFYYGGADKYVGVAETSLNH